MIITVDFDNTLFVDSYPEVGRPVPHMAKSIKALAEDHTLILNTCREDEPLYNAMRALEGMYLLDRFTSINKWDPESLLKWGLDCRKIVGDQNIDDKNVGCPLAPFEDTWVVEWLEVMERLDVTN